MTKVLQILKKAKTRAIPLGNHVTQQKLIEMGKQPKIGRS